MKESVTIFYARRLPVSTAVSGFTYVFEVWVLSANDEKVLDGVYIRIPRVTLNVSSASGVELDIKRSNCSIQNN